MCIRDRYKGKSIYDVLEMTVEEGLEFFRNMPKIARKLQTLYAVSYTHLDVYKRQCKYGDVFSLAVLLGRGLDLL